MAEITDTRVVGAHLSEYIGKHVRVFATVVRLESNGENGLFRLSDGVEVRVKIATENELNEDLIEMVAYVEAPNQLKMLAWYPVKCANKDEFMKLADQVITMIHRPDIRDSFMD